MKALRHLGDASYSLYLWHILLYVLIGRAVTTLACGGHFSPLFFILVPVAIVAGGIAIYRFFEVPLLAKVELSLTISFPIRWSRSLAESSSRTSTCSFD